LGRERIRIALLRPDAKPDSHIATFVVNSCGSRMPQAAAQAALFVIWQMTTFAYKSVQISTNCRQKKFSVTATIAC
jgi:hypothetical protein